MASRGHGSKNSGSNYFTRENEVFIIKGKKVQAKPISEIYKHFGYIYITKDLINSKYYLGLRFKRRGTLSYLGSGKYLKSAIAKYGKFNFYKIIIDFADNQEELEELEQYYIQHYFGYDIAYSPLWYNIFDGKQRGGNSWAGYSLSDRKRRRHLMSSHMKNRKLSKKQRDFSSRFMSNYFKDSANRVKTSIATRKKMDTKEIADKTNHYIQYPVFIKGKPYYSSAQIARSYHLDQGYVYRRLRAGMDPQKVIIPPISKTDRRYYRDHFGSYINRIKDYEAYARMYKVCTYHNEYLFLSSSYPKLARLITKYTECSIGKNSVFKMIKKHKRNFQGIVSISRIQDIPDKYKLLYACCTLNYRMQNKKWDGMVVYHPLRKEVC